VPLKASSSAQRNLDTFGYLLAQAGALPQLVVTYEREAYVSEHETYARVTFDRRIVAAPTTQWAPPTAGGELAYLDAGPTGGLSVTVLELKSETRLPSRMVDLVRSHRLMRRGFSKYCSGVEATGSYLLRPQTMAEGWGGPEYV
jgi:hypothetical protein